MIPEFKEKHDNIVKLVSPEETVLLAEMLALLMPQVDQASAIFAHLLNHYDRGIISLSDVQVENIRKWSTNSLLVRENINSLNKRDMLS